MKKIFIVFCSFVLAFGLFFAIKVNAKTGIQKIDGLVCNPGEDCSTELRFAWRSSEPSCYFYFTSNTDTEFANASKVRVIGTLDTEGFPNQSTDDIVNLTPYTYEYEVAGLVPGTKYLYKVSTLKNEATSPVHNATTASLNGSFNFLLIGDNHLTCASWSKRSTFTWNMMKGAINNITKAGRGDTSLIISTGDTVAYGSYYDDHLEWDESIAFANYIFADSPGNHDYYERRTGSSKMTTYPISWEASRNMPDNGYASYVDQGYKSNYWFIYNSCLFISIDSIASGKSYTDQKQWLINTVQSLEGQFQWLIVYEHYPFFDGETASTKHYTNSGYISWWDTFDLLGVDLALSGDSHVYLRSKPLRNNQVDPNGTVYMTCAQIGDRYRFITERQNDDWMAVRIGTGTEGNTTNYGLQDMSGMGYVMVTPEELTYCLIDTSLQVKDTYTIAARRSIPEGLRDKQAEQNAILRDSFEFIGHNGSDSETLVFDYNRVGYMKSLQVMNGDTTIINTSSFTGSCIDLGNLEDNKVYDLDVTVTFVDGTMALFKIHGSTYAPYGTISDFKVYVEDGKTVLKWNANTNDTIDKYEVFEGTTSLGTTTSNSFALNVKKDIDAVYTLRAYTKNNEVIYEAYADYKLYGDINYDGAINNSDCDSIAAAIFSGAELSGREKTFADLNNDGKVNFADAAMIMMYQAGKIENTVSANFTVTFKDETGKDITTVIVQYGDDAVAPTPASKDGYTFIGWSKPVTNVRSNLVVYAIYQKNN